MTRNFQKTLKRKKRCTPKKTKVYYVREKTGKRICGLCSGILMGIPHGKTDSKINALSKTEKRPSVPFGGVLCSKCRRKIISEKVKIEAGIKKIDDLEHNTKKFVKQVIRND